ncbi:MAG: hypothetical protein ACYC5S_01920 [Thiobacillus sp.]
MSTELTAMPDDRRKGKLRTALLLAAFALAQFLFTLYTGLK